MNYGTVQRRAVLALSVAALLYALAAGLRTVADPDLGWTLATGRYVVQQHRLPWTDRFSYTAAGREFIYPFFSGVLLYLVHTLGGYAALSWLGALVCVFVVALLLWAEPAAGVATAALAVAAVPAIAARSVPRADLFSTLLFAVFLSLLWRHHRMENEAGVGRVPLWLLPAAMLAWVNLHLGFVAGLALAGLYVLLELCELPYAGRRSAARVRLWRAAPWLAASAAATLVNPWGARIYLALFRQKQLLQSLEGWAGDWMRLRPSKAMLAEALDWRGPDGAYWWLLAAAFVAVAVYAFRRQFGPAVFMLLVALGSVRYVRFQALFMMATVVVAGAALARGAQSHDEPARQHPFRTAAALAVSAAVLLLAGIRISDLVSNRYYLSTQELCVFGPGPSWWFPERATQFILREKLPGHIFNHYNLGGYLIWALGPAYPVYIDGRAVPFGASFIVNQRNLVSQPPDSPAWEHEADSRGIRTIILSTTRFPALGGMPLYPFCTSLAWRPVYLDEVAAVFVRNRPENAPWLERLQIDCATQRFQPPDSRNRAVLYNFYANAGLVFFALGRYQEASAALERAHSLFPYDLNLPAVASGAGGDTKWLRPQ